MKLSQVKWVLIFLILIATRSIAVIKETNLQWDALNYSIKLIAFGLQIMFVHESVENVTKNIEE